MLYYDPGKDQTLEVHISETYSVLDLERLLLFIDALTSKSHLRVNFNIHPSLKNQFLTCLDSAVSTPSFQFNIN
jgi:hypothetical protein